MAGQLPTTFSMNYVATSIASLPIVTGYAEGDGLTIEFPNDDFERQESSDGFVIWVQKHNTVAECMLRLGQGNPLIALIRTLHQASLLAGGLHYQFGAANLKSLDEVVSGSMIFKKHVPIKWSDTGQPAEIPFDLQVSNIAGGTLLA